MNRDELEVCKKCGWHASYGHARECDPEAGKLADQLMAAVDVSAVVDVPMTKLGYGSKRVTFNFSENKSLTIDVCRGRLSVERIFWLPEDDEGRFSVEQVTALVKALAGAAKVK